MSKSARSTFWRIFANEPLPMSSKIFFGPASTRKLEQAPSASGHVALFPNTVNFIYSPSQKAYRSDRVFINRSGFCSPEQNIAELPLRQSKFCCIAVSMNVQRCCRFIHCFQADNRIHTGDAEEFFRLAVVC